MDNAGNNAPPVSVTYSVDYLFSGFFAPLSPGIAGPFKAGSTVPLKWQLQNASGAVVGSLSSIKSIQMAYNGGHCAGSTDDTSVVADSPGSSGLRFDGTQFGFNWKTPSSATGCFSVLVGLDDGSTHSQIVTLK